MSGFWEGAGVLLGIALFFGFTNGVSRMAEGVPRIRAYRNAVLAATIFAAFSYVYSGSGYHVEGTDRLMGTDSEIVENEPPEHPTSKLDAAIKVFVISLGCFCYGIYKSNPNNKPGPLETSRHF